MVLNGCKMNIDCLRKTQSLDRLVLKRFPSRRERGQQGAAQRQQNGIATGVRNIAAGRLFSPGLTMPRVRCSAAAQRRTSDSGH